MLDTPILFLIFKRPDLTKLVFEQICAAKPKYLYIAADGPKNDKEKHLCEETRNLVIKNIDWNCEVKTLFRDKNKGLRKGVSESITWFFENVDEGIILEDDCIPSPSFFSFCTQMLDKYRNDDKIMHISGETQLKENMTADSYYFSNFAHIWGWATWKRAWNLFDVEMSDYKDFLKQKKIKQISKSKYHQNDWLKVFNKVYKKEIDSWGYVWIYTLINNNGLSISPNTNLISNIGFDERATHTLDNKSNLANKNLSVINLELKHPEELSIDYNIQYNVINKRYNMLDGFSVERYKVLKILIREINRAFYKIRKKLSCIRS